MAMDRGVPRVAENRERDAELDGGGFGAGGPVVALKVMLAWRRGSRRRPATHHAAAEAARDSETLQGHRNVMKPAQPSKEATQQCRCVAFDNF